MYNKASDNDLILNEDGDLYAAEPEAGEDGAVPPAGTPTDDPLALGEDEEENAF